MVFFWLVIVFLVGVDFYHLKCLDLFCFVFFIQWLYLAPSIFSLCGFKVTYSTISGGVVMYGFF